MADVIAKALRRRRWLRTAAILAALGLAFASYASHRAAPVSAASLDGHKAFVEHIVDGDEILIRTLAGRERVRLRGIDAPEADRPVEFWGVNSKRYLEARVGNRPVVLKFDPPQTHDQYGRLLAFVYVDEGECINLALVRDGQAYADRRVDSYMRSQLEQAETQARKKGTGLWKTVRDEDQPAWRREWLAQQRAKD